MSGVGPVVEGVQFSNGWCVLRWMSRRSSIAFYQSLEDVKAIHGHDGKTEIIIHDFEAIERRTRPSQDSSFETFMLIVEEIARILTTAQEAGAREDEIQEAFDGIARQLNLFREEIIRKRQRRTA